MRANLQEYMDRREAWQATEGVVSFGKNSATPLRQESGPDRPGGALSLAGREVRKREKRCVGAPSRKPLKGFGKVPPAPLEWYD